MAGRPTKLTPLLIKKAAAFVDGRRSDRAPLPTVEGLALELGISRDTVYEWADKPGQFSDIVSDLKSAQAEKLVQLSLTGRYNAAIAKLILSGKHGYVEKQQTDLTSNGKDIAPVLVKFVGDAEPES